MDETTVPGNMTILDDLKKFEMKDDSPKEYEESKNESFRKMSDNILATQLQSQMTLSRKN